MRWPSEWRGWLAAAGVLATLAITALDIAQHYTTAVGVALAIGIARALPLLICWSRPVTALGISTAVALITALLITPVSSSEPWPWPVTGLAGQIAVIVILGARCAGDSRQLRNILAATWLATQAVGVIALLGTADRGRWVDLLPAAISSAAAVVVADLLRSRADVRTRLVRQEAATATVQEQQARTEERTRIARELHDVVAHHLSVVVVRADSAPHRVAGLDDDARAEFAAIADDARTSLDEMRRVLRLLRADDEHPVAQLTPQPDLASVGELVQRARAAGAQVRFSQQLRVGVVDPAVQLTAYRVVQEALSNALRHAPDASVDISLAHNGSELSVDVRNAASARRPESTGIGQGLRGMLERVTLVDGTLSAGADPAGGFQVHAVIPLAGTRA
ncbi:MAG: sensor histidine kinase [Jatrophihabitans sp.]